MERKLIHPMIAIAALAFALPATADVGPGSFTYEGRVYESNGSPSARVVNMRLQILDPAGNCVLRDEVKTGVDLSQTGGTFAVSVGTGTTHGDDAGLSIANIYRNSGAALTGRNSANTATNCTYTPAAGDVRKLRIIVDGVAMTPDISINSVPYAVSADSLRGKAPSDFLSPRFDSGYALTQGNLETVFSTAAKATELSALASGTSTIYMRNGPTAGAAVPQFASTPSSAAMGSFWYDTTTNTLKYKDNSGVQTLSSGSSGISALTGDVTATGPGSAAATIAAGAVTSAKIADGSVTSVDIAPAAVSFAKFQNITTGRILGRSTVSSGPIEEISLGAGLTLTSGVLSASGGTDSFAALPCSTNHVPFHNGSGWTCVVASNLDAANTIVKRDAAGNFNANIVKMNGLALQNSGSVVNVVTPLGAAYNWTLPASQGSAGTFLRNDGAGNLSWVAPGGAGDFRADGTIAMTGQLQASSTGNQNVPQYTFAADTDSGLYRSTNDTIGLATQGTSRLHVAPDGKVGIGTIAPQSVFTVYSSAFAETTYMNPNSAFGFSVGLAETMNSLSSFTGGFTHPNNTAYLINENSTPIVFSISNTMPMLIKPDGGVEIKGGVKIGTYGVTCSTPTIGTLRFNVGKIEYCNGTAWQALSTGGTPSAGGAGTGPFDFAVTSVRSTTSPCATFTLHNMKDGGVYKFGVLGVSSSTCSFNIYSDAGISPLTVRLPTNHGPVTSEKSLYTFTVIGSEVFAERSLY